MTGVRRCQPWLGTFVEVSVEGAASALALRDISDRALRTVRAIHEMMSFHDSSSELSRVNRLALANRIEISADMHTVLRAALAMSEASDGAFDVCVGATLVRQRVLPSTGTPARRGGTWRDIELDGAGVRFHRPLVLDLGGIAKGYAVDRACASIPEELQFCVNGGGDLRMNPWHGATTAIRLPGTQGLARVVPMRAAALASSGDQGRDRYSLCVGHEGRRQRRAAKTWSVFAPSAMIADALTKVLRLHSNPLIVLGQYGACGMVFESNGVASNLVGGQLQPRECA